MRLDHQREGIGRLSHLPAWSLVLNRSAGGVPNAVENKNAAHFP
jgi:hypothetical protein